MLRLLKYIACTGVISALFSTSVLADATVSSGKFNMPAAITTDITATDCENSPGPTITLGGNILLGGLSADVVLQNNAKGTHKVEVTFATNISLVVAGAPIELPKQPVQGGTGGNPHIWIQFLNGNSQALSTQIYLGRCVQGLKHVDAALLAQALAALDISIIGCENNPGPKIYLGGGLAFTSGLKARFFFANAVNSQGGPHQAVVTRDVTLIGAGTVMTIPKQPSQGGAGGNPIISIQFRHGNGNPIGNLITLGRCNKI